MSNNTDNAITEETAVLDITAEITEENLPEVLDKHVNELDELGKQIEKALKNAGSARKTAEEAASVSAGFWHRKNAIESLQSAVEELGNATADNADSQKLLFNCLRKMANVEKIILQIGCMSIAANRTTIRQLELKLSGASKEKFSELSKKEFQSVLNQVRQQQDILEKQDRVERNIKILHEESKNYKARLDRKDDLDSSQSVAIAENKKRLDEKELLDLEQTERLEKLESLLVDKNQIDQRQEEALEVLIEYTKQKDILDRQQSEDIKKLMNSSPQKQNSKSIVISCIAIICSLVSLLINFVGRS